MDDRQRTPPSQERVDELQSHGVPAIVRRLDLGDYQWTVDDEVYLVEEKLIPDLLNSVTDGRLGKFTQADIPAHVRRSVLIVGTYEYGVESHGGHWTPDSIDNLLSDVQRGGVSILRTVAPGKAAERLASYWRHSGGGGRTLDRPTLPQTNKWYLDPGKREAVRLLMCLPGIGEVGANALLAEHGSIDTVLHCLTENDSCKANGIGSKTITTSRAYLQRKFK